MAPATQGQGLPHQAVAQADCSILGVDDHPGDDGPVTVELLYPRAVSDGLHAAGRVHRRVAVGDDPDELAAPLHGEEPMGDREASASVMEMCELIIVLPGALTDCHLLGHGAARGLLVGPVVDVDVLAPALPDHDRGVQILL